MALAANDARKKILIVDDDDRLHERAGEFLGGQGFLCRDVTDPRKTLEMLESYQPDIVLLDVTMPDEDGFSVLLKIRKVSKVPVIMLTARGKDTDRIIGLELGADDYLPKPFNPQELVARIKAVLRRSESAGGEDAALRREEGERKAVDVAISAGEIRVGAYVLDARQQTLSFRGNTTSVSTAELCILHAFMTNAGKAMGRDELMHLAFGSDEHATIRSVDVHISRLRNLLRDIGETKTRIRTVWGTGYCWNED